MLKKIILISIIVLALAGAVDSAYALKLHLAPVNESFCDASPTVSCTTVNQSEYAVFYGVPVAAIGLGGYVWFGLLAAVMLARKQVGSLPRLALLLTALGGVIFSAWLTYLELYVIKAICLLCVTSQVLVTMILLLAGVWMVMGLRKPGNTG